ENAQLERYSLPGGKREKVSTLPMKSVRVAAMGAASRGPLCLIGDERMRFLDLETLRPVKAPFRGNAGFGFGGAAAPDKPPAAANGRLFGHWRSRVTPTGIASVKLTPGGIEAHYEHQSTHHAVPGPDGKHIFTGFGILTDDLRGSGDKLNEFRID